MTKAVARIAGLGFAALLVLPTIAHAGLIDWIYEMSGPQFIGYTIFHCDVGVGNGDRDPENPSLAPVAVRNAQANRANQADQPQINQTDQTSRRNDPDTGWTVSCPNPFFFSIPSRPWWFSLDTTLYISTGKDSGDHMYTKFDTLMLAFDPMYGRRKKIWTQGQDNDFFVHAGGGGTFHVLHGKFGHFYKGGVKLQGGFAFQKGQFAMDITGNIRLYPDRFSEAQLGVGPSTDKDREWVRRNITVGLRLPPLPW